MKFAEHLSSHLTPEWRKQYIQYEQMKTILYAMFDGLAPGAEIDDEVRRRHLTQKEETFFKFCADELNKINLFFNQKMAEAQTKFRDLNREIDVLQKIAQSKSKKERHRPTMPIINRLNARRNAADEKSLLTSGGQQPSTSQVDEKVQPKTLRELKTAFAEFYLSLVLVQNYQQLNCTGFRKILKKHDKLLMTESGSEWFQQNVEHAAFVDNKEIDTLISNTEKVVTDNLESGNRQAAMKRLRVPPLSEAQNAWTTFRLGFFLGSFLVLSFLILLTVLLQDRPDEPRWVGVRLFRGFFILFANLFFMGINMYGWQSSGVNHVLIFEIDPRDHLTYQSLMEISSFFLMTWALCVLGYLHSHSLHIPPTPFPLILLLVSLLWLINPLPIMQKTARYWFIRHTFYCFSAPFHKVTFPDFWLADQMNSLVTFFLDMEYLTCFYINYVDYSKGMKIIVKNTWTEFNSRNDTLDLFNYTSAITYHANNGIDAYSGADQCMSNVYGIRPIISCLPALIRFLQCIRRCRDSKQKHPHLTNAGKYATTFFVVIFGSLNTYYKRHSGDNAFFYFWILSYVISFMYTYTWDIKMDWGLLDNSATTDKLLRDELIYDHKAYYYAAMVEDFVLRLAWVMNVSLGDAWSTEADLLMFITAPLECLRRFIWNYFRLENEHVNNCGHFRAIRDIHVAPISRRTDWDDMENKMDDDDGVQHRGTQYQQLKDKKLKNRSRKSVIRRKIVQTLRPGGGSSSSALFTGVGDTKRRLLFPRHNSLFVATPSASSSRTAIVKMDYPSVRNTKEEQRPGLKNILEPLISGGQSLKEASDTALMRAPTLLSPNTAAAAQERDKMERKKTIFTLHETDDIEPLTPKQSVTSSPRSPHFDKSDAHHRSSS